MNIDPTALVIWLLIGAIAGWLAGQIMKGGGFGLAWHAAQAPVAFAAVAALLMTWIYSLVAVETDTS